MTDCLFALAFARARPKPLTDLSILLSFYPLRFPRQILFNENLMCNKVSYKQVLITNQKVAEKNKITITTMAQEDEIEVNEAMEDDIEDAELNTDDSPTDDNGDAVE